MRQSMMHSAKTYGYVDTSTQAKRKRGNTQRCRAGSATGQSRVGSSRENERNLPHGRRSRPRNTLASRYPVLNYVLTTIVLQTDSSKPLLRESPFFQRTLRIYRTVSIFYDQFQGKLIIHFFLSLWEKRVCVSIFYDKISPCHERALEKVW